MVMEADEEQLSELEPRPERCVEFLGSEVLRKEAGGFGMGFSFSQGPKHLNHQCSVLSGREMRSGHGDSVPARQNGRFGLEA